MPDGMGSHQFHSECYAMKSSDLTRTLSVEATVIECLPRDFLYESHWPFLVKQEAQITIPSSGRRPDPDDRWVAESLT